tara:strand:- start:106 stop:321 length:216 start_codon:yes stop_codon:yes gene_type:complete
VNNPKCKLVVYVVSPRIGQGFKRLRSSKFSTELEAPKKINRKLFVIIPPRVEYLLNKKGKILLSIFDRLNK